MFHRPRMSDAFLSDTVDTTTDYTLCLKKRVNFETV